MLQQSILREYRRQRAEGARAATALAIARGKAARADYEWAHEEFPFEFERDGFEIRISVDCDNSPDTSWLGEWSDRWAPGCVDVDRGSRFYRYFHPATTEEEHYAELRKLHYGKNEARRLAREYVARDLKTALEESWYMIRVTASRDGIELGSDSLGGVDSDYVVDAIADHDMVENAIGEARAALAKLCDCGSG